MVLLSEPSQWSVKRFGKEYAHDLWELVPKAIATGVARKIEAQKASGLRKLHAYGGAWPAVPEEILDVVGCLDGVRKVPPKGSHVQFVVVNDYLLAPFNYAEKMTTKLTDRTVAKKLNMTLRRLLNQYGPEPATEQLVLDEELFPLSENETPSEPILSTDAAPSGVIIVYFAANVDDGLLSVGWGEATPVSDGLDWQHTEWLPLPN
jgi:hypothetical protein